MKIAVIILNWNGKALMERFLPSVVAYSAAAPETEGVQASEAEVSRTQAGAQTLETEGVNPLGTAGAKTLEGKAAVPETQQIRPFEVEVVVADNGSTDGSVEWLRAEWPQVKCVCFDRNYGFAEGYNKAVEAVPCDLAVLLNSDVQVTENWLSPLVGYMQAHSDVAACQPKIRAVKSPEYFEYAGAAGGYLDRLGYPFCRGRLQSEVEKDLGQYDTVADVLWATGACLLVRRQAYLDAGGLDAGFFAHMEEIDLCWRLRSRGWRLVCVPQSVVYHLGGATLSADNPRKTFLNFRNNLLMLYKNLPDKDLRRTMRLRALFDWLAALFFLLKGETGNFRAVFQARREFRRLKPQWTPMRERIRREAVLEFIPEIYSGISVLDFYLKGKKTFDRLVWKSGRCR